MLAKVFIPAAAFFASTLAAQSAGVTIEASHGGAGNDLTNTTITIKINSVYNNETILDEVSTLYLTGATGVPIDSITCTPFSHKDGSGKSGQSFNSTTPSLLSTNTIQVGSIVCITSHILQAPPGGSSSSSTRGTSTTLATTPGLRQSGASSLTAAHPTGARSSATSSASAASSQSAGNSASNLYLSGEFFGGLALGAFGLAFVL